MNTTVMWYTYACRQTLTHIQSLKKNSQQNQLSRAHSSSQRLKWGFMKSTWVYTRSSVNMLWFFTLVFLLDSQQWELRCLWLFCQLLESFSSYWVSLSSFDMGVYAWSYCILLCHVWLMPLGDLPFTEGKQRRKGSTGMGNRRGGKRGELNCATLGYIVWQKNG